MRTLPMSFAAIGLLGFALMPSGAMATVVPAPAALADTTPSLDIESVHWAPYRHCEYIGRGLAREHGGRDRRGDRIIPAQFCRVWDRGRQLWERERFRWETSTRGFDGRASRSS
jgi:hypothetical protein